MHFKNKIINNTLAIICSLAVFLGASFSIPITADAATAPSLKQILDIACTKNGVVANDDILSKLQTSWLNALNGTVSTYNEYCSSNGLEKNADTWKQYLNSDNYMADPFSAIVGRVFQATYFMDWLFNGGQMREDFLEGDYYQTLVNTSLVAQGNNYVIADDFVDATISTFNSNKDSWSSVRYYHTTIPSEMKLSWFKDGDSYNAFKQYVASSEFLTIGSFKVYSNVSKYFAENSTSSAGDYAIYRNDYETLYIVESSSKKTITFYGADFNTKSIEFKNPYGLTITSVSEFGTPDGSKSKIPAGLWELPAVTPFEYEFSVVIFSKEKQAVPIYKNTDAMAQYTQGNREYYLSDKYYNYSEENDNSITVGGDYITGDYTYSYEIVNNNITNSENITDNSINNIVNDNSNTIINNYYNSDSGNDDADGGIFDLGSALQAILKGIGDILNFLITLIGELLSMIANFLTEIMNLLGSLKGISGDFVFFMQDYFVFVPPELWDVIKVGLYASIAVMVVKSLKK